MAEELRAEFLRLLHQFGEGEDRVVIGNLRTDDGSYTKCKGRDPDCRLEEGMPYVFLGRWVNHEKYGEQFHFSSFAPCRPHGKRAVIRYLSSAPGLGHTSAEKLWGIYGEDAIERIRENPAGVAAGIPHLNTVNAIKASEWLGRQQIMEQTFLDVYGLLDGRNFPKSLVQRVIDKYGARAGDQIRENPYCLLAEKGVGFLRADKLYLDLEKDPAADIRQKLCMWHFAANGMSGDTWRPLGACLSDLRGALSEANCDRAVRLAEEDGYVEVRRDGEGDRWITRKVRADQERAIAGQVSELLAEPTQWPDMTNDTLLTPHQMEACHHALANPIGCLIGTPGVGKTLASARLAKAIVREHGPHQLAVAAPTGKAAIRVTEAMQQAGLDITATTVHALMGARGDEDGEQVSMSGHSLEAKFLLLDEWSMGGTELTSWVLSACQQGTHVLFVGDVEQLSPVGHGCCLRDMLAAGVPYGELTEIKRNWGRIVATCKEMREGKEPIFSEKMDRAAGENLYLIDQRNPKRQLAALRGLLEKIREAGEFDVAWQCQVLCAVNRGNPIARRELNEVLQEMLNPNGKGVAGSPFRVCDKVISTKNQWLPSEDDDPVVPMRDGKVYVANGEIGEVLEVEPRRILVELTGPYRLARVPRGRVNESEDSDSGDNTGCKFSLGYAISTHKCVHPDTIVETEDGLLPIRMIEKCGVIATGSGPKQYRGRVSYSATSSLRFTTEFGHDITVTENHRCEVIRDGEPQKVMAKDVRHGDWVRQKIGAVVEPTCPNYLPLENRRDPRAERHRTPLKMTYDLALFLGMMVADGVVTRAGFRYCKLHEECVDLFDVLCNKLFGVKTSRKNRIGCYESSVNSTFLRDWVSEIGGMSPHGKAIPSAILRSPSSMHAPFLKGLFEDGSVHGKCGTLDHIQLNQVKRGILDISQEMLRRLGILSSRGKNNGSIYIYGRDCLAFRDRVGLVSKKKQDRLYNLIPRQSFSRSRIPCSREMIGSLKSWPLGKSVRERARSLGYIGRTIAESLIDTHPWVAESLSWNYSRIKTIEAVEAPSMCVEVPDGNRFLQNGLPWWNSQGSQWPIVVTMLDGSPSAGWVCNRAWLYTAISRAEDACVLIGSPQVVREMCGAREVRKTFLRELIEGELRCMS